MIVIECTENGMSFKLSKSSAIYFLKLSGKIVYVGKSVNVFSRIFGNHTADKEFDEVELVWCPEHLLNEREKYFINLHKPLLNDWSHERKSSKTRAQYAKHRPKTELS